jgi:hypothetical protein
MVENPTHVNEIFFTQNTPVNYTVSFGTHFPNKIIISQKAFITHYTITKGNNRHVYQ